MEEKQDKRSRCSPLVNSCTPASLSWTCDVTAEWVQLLPLLTLRSALPPRGESSLPEPGALSYQLTWMEEIRRKPALQVTGGHMIKQTQEKKKSEPTI